VVTGVKIILTNPYLKLPQVTDQLNPLHTITLDGFYQITVSLNIPAINSRSAKNTT